MIILPEKTLHKIYDLLEEYMGVYPWKRNEYINYFLDRQGDTYLLEGNIGIVGSFNNLGGRLYISPYIKNKIGQMDDIEIVNNLLTELLVDYILNF